MCRYRYDPTIEDSYSVTRTVDGLSYHLSLTDTAGQEEYRGLWASSNLKSDAFLLVYDITNANSLEGLSWFLDMIEIEAESRIEENNRLLKERGTRVKGKTDEGWKPPPVIIIAGNKSDLNDARVVQSKTGWDYARSRGCGFMETSARDMVNIEETFACLWNHINDVTVLTIVRDCP
jgi:GTPase KRas protein